MSAGNRSPLGFGTITFFVLSVLGGGVLLQVVRDRFGPWPAATAAVVMLAGFVVAGVLAPRFFWDFFRGIKTAAVLLTLLVLSCILGTLIIQDLDLRRAGVFAKGEKEGDQLPPFDDRLQSVRFALAESHMLLWLRPNAERERMIAEKVKLSPVEREQVALRERAFGAKAAKAYEEAILHQKTRQVEQLTTSNYARDNFAWLYELWTWLRRLHLFDIFEAWWFFILLGLIATNVTVATLALAPWSVRQFGIAVTHAGVVIVLSGSLLDLLVAKEGYIYFKYGKPDEQIASMIGDEKDQLYHHLPFRVYLDRFATEYYHELLVERSDWSRRHDGRPWPAEGGHRHGEPFSVASLFPVREGITRVFEGGEVEVIVHDYKPRVILKTVVDDVPDGPLQPAVRLGLYTDPSGGKNYFVHGSYEPWFHAFDERRSVDMYGCRFEYVWADDSAQYQRLVDQPPLPDNGTLVVRSGGATEQVPVALGRTREVEVGGKRISVEFLTIQSALAESENVNLDRRLQKSEEPTLHVRVNGQPLPVPRDDSEFTRDFNVLDGVEFRFDWPNPKDAGVLAIFRVVDGEGRGPVLVQVDDNDRVIAQPLGNGPAVALPLLPGAFLGLEQRVRSGRERRAIEEISDEEFLGDTGGGEIALSEALRAYFDAKGERGLEYAAACRNLLARLPDTAPHLLAGWREVLSMAPSGGESTPLAEWEAFLRDRDPDLPAAWRKYTGRQGGQLEERLLAAWADIEVRGPWGTVRREITPSDRPIHYGPDPSQPLLRLALVKTEQARDWFSVLSVIDHRDWKVHTHAVQVNSPLRYGGYRFFQATAATDRDGLGISGISVTRNPGVLFMYVGYTVLTIGTCYVFFLRPYIDRRRRNRRLAEIESR